MEMDKNGDLAGRKWAPLPRNTGASDIIVAFCIVGVMVRWRAVGGFRVIPNVLMFGDGESIGLEDA